MLGYLFCNCDGVSSCRGLDFVHLPVVLILLQVDAKVEMRKYLPLIGVWRWYWLAAILCLKPKL